MHTKGSRFKEALDALDLQGTERADTERNAAEIIAAIIAAFGTRADGALDARRIPNAPITGLVYGRIQSGKTRAMIASTAMAFDNQFRISVVMTSNINDLVAQTHMDFSTGLPGLKILTKDDALEREIDDVKLYLSKTDGCLLIVCSKGSKSLNNVVRFLTSIRGVDYPTIIFDDEGDQASLDTNTRKRAKSAVAVGPSKINDIIQNKLRPAVARHVYVSVTGTPQAVLLQSADSSHRPSFIKMLPAGASYVGGEQFFSQDEPEDNQRLISLVDRNEKAQLLNSRDPIPAGLRASILFFLVAASAAIKNIGLRQHGYSYLCHPSLKNDEQAKAEARIGKFLTGVLDVLLDDRDGDILQGLRAAHARLKATLGDKTPSFNDIKNVLKQYLPLKKILVINTKVKRQGIAYGKGLNFLIGGNTLGRGIAIKDLLVTYYVREAKVSQIDTMHQHARMYGYRSVTIEYTRLFIPKHLYYRFRDIYRSDEDLRAYIEKYQSMPATFPIEYTYGLRPTRPGVLDVKKIDTLLPGKQLYPNHVVLPQPAASYRKVLDMTRETFGMPSNTTPDRMEDRGKNGVMIDVARAVALVKPIKTRSRNVWRDSTIADVIAKVAEKFGGKIMLRMRTAERRVEAEGFISQGILFGGSLTAARQANVPTLWIFAAATTAESEGGAGQLFVYPTFVIPDSYPTLFMFNRGQ
jgi:Z1 domain-containing protein